MYNCMFSTIYSYSSMIVIYLYTVTWLEEFSFNTNNLKAHLFYTTIGPYQVQVPQDRVDLK